MWVAGDSGAAVSWSLMRHAFCPLAAADESGAPSHVVRRQAPNAFDYTATRQDKTHKPFSSSHTPSKQNTLLPARVRGNAPEPTTRQATHPTDAANTAAAQRTHLVVTRMRHHLLASTTVVDIPQPHLLRFHAGIKAWGCAGQCGCIPSMLPLAFYQAGALFLLGLPRGFSFPTPHSHLTYLTSTHSHTQPWDVSSSQPRPWSPSPPSKPPPWPSAPPPPPPPAAACTCSGAANKPKSLSP